jgi:hypothetical protein
MKSLRRIRKREGRCYELAARAILFDPEAVRLSLVLVHGEINGPPEQTNPGHASFTRIGHAWIEASDGRTYDPVRDEWMDTPEYVDRAHAVAQKRYTRAEAFHQVATTDSYGPWPSPAAPPALDGRGPRA